MSLSEGKYSQKKQHEVLNIHNRMRSLAGAEQHKRSLAEKEEKRADVEK